MGKTHIWKALDELGFTDAPGINRYRIKGTEIYATLYPKNIGTRVIITVGMEDYRFFHTDKDGNITDEQKAHMKKTIVQFMFGEQL